MDPTVERSAAEEWKAGWRVVAACAVGMGLTTIHFYTLGLFIAPIAETYGWSRAQITAGPAISSVILFFVASRVGRMADLLGVRRVAMAGFVGYALGLAALGLAGPSIWSWYAVWLFIAICHPFAGIAIWSLAIASRFDRSRGLALAAALSGPGVVATLIPSIASYLLARFGWSTSYAILGGASLLIALPILFAWLRSARDLAARLPKTVAAPMPAAGGLTFREALRSRAFWSLFGLLAASSVLILVFTLSMARVQKVAQNAAHRRVIIDDQHLGGGDAHLGNPLALVARGRCLASARHD